MDQREQEMMAHMLYRGMMDPRLDDTTRLHLSYVYKSLPHPPVSVAAPLSNAAAAAWAPSEGVDRISRLPADVLRNIVGRLPAKDAARTTALSTRWRRIWHSVPLALVDAHLLPALGIAQRLGIDRRAADSRAVTAAVSRVLAAHPGPFRCVHLSCASMDEHRSEVARWLQILAVKGIQELVFINRPWPRHLPLPAALFSCAASLIRLYIGIWRFPDTATLPRAAAFPHLRELGLCSVVMEDRDLAFLLDKCPVLENLLIVGNMAILRLRVVNHSLRCVQVCTSIVEDLTVAHAAHLERLLLWEAWGTLEDPSKLVPGTTVLPPMRSRVKIGHAPKLRVLGFLVPGMHELEIGNTVIKAGTKASPSTTLPSVQMLGIQVKLADRSEARMMPSFLRCFPNVETLYIQSENADKPAGKLDLKFWKEAGPIECVLRHIKKVVFREFRGQRSEHDFLKFIAERARVLEKMVIVLTHGCSVDREGAKLRTCIASAKWANAACKLMVVASPFPEKGTAWCFLGAFNFAKKDPFDTLSCMEGEDGCKAPC